MQLKLPAKRNPLGKMTDVKEKLEGMLRQRLGVPTGDPPLVQKVEDFHIYLQHDHPVFSRNKEDQTDQFALVFSGMVRLTLGQEVMTLRRGDAVQIQARMPHLWENASGRSTQIVLVSLRSVR